MPRTAITRLSVRQGTSHDGCGCAVSPRCAVECAVLCAARLRTQGRPRPRQHWGFACLLSPTTRPPRRNGLGEVRVVGLSSACGSVQAGAGPVRQGSVRGEELHNKQQLEDKRHKNSNGGRAGEGDLGVGRRTGVTNVCGLGEVAPWVGV